MNSIKIDVQVLNIVVLFQGLNPKAFYWEFINTLRKGLVLCCNVFFATISPYYQVLSSVLILIAVLRLQIFIKPYKNNINNELEQNAINACILTLLCGIIFLQTDSNHEVFDSFTLAFLIVVNLIFIIKWTFFMLLSLNIKNKKFKWFMNYFAIFIMKKEYLEAYSTHQTPTVGTVNVLDFKISDNMASTDRLNGLPHKKGKKSGRIKLKKVRFLGRNPDKVLIEKGIKKGRKK